MAVVTNIDEEHSTIGIKHGTVDTDFTRNLFLPIKYKFIQNGEVPKASINIRKKQRGLRDTK